jgi:hypothetical protein
LLAFVLAQHARINENCGKLVAYRAVYQSRCHGRINAAADSAQHGPVTNLRAYALDAIRDD